MKFKLNPKIIVLSVILAITLISTTSILGVSYNINKNKVSKGIFIDGLDISKLTESELKDKLQNHFSKKLNNNKITFNYKTGSKTKSLNELGVEFNLDEITKNALSKNKTKIFFIDGAKFLNPSPTRTDLKLNPSINEDELDEFIISLNKDLNKNVKSAKINFNNNTIQYVPGTPTTEVDKDKLIDNILDSIKASENISSKAETINIPTKEVTPVFSPETFSKMTVISSFKTALPNANAVRTNNIRLFMSKLNGTIVMPGNIFSADKTAGRREIADGYGAAPAFASNKVVNSVAGGICQGVTTLYNAVVYSDLEIVERAPHAMLVSYIEAGRDATIASGFIDFKFKNNKKNPIVLQTYVGSDGYVVAKIWGINDTPNKEIKIVVNHFNSLNSITYKQTYENGKLVKSEVLSRDTYNAH